MATTMTRWRPFADFSDLRNRIDAVLEDVMSPEGGVWSPAIDLVESDGALVFRADVPGMKPEEIKIELEGDVLTISGEHEETKEAKDEQYLRRERRYGSFSRSMRVPAGIDPDKIEASCHDGVLEVKVPKPAEAESRKVTIKPKAE
jgi:HSP20 family protein